MGRWSTLSLSQGSSAEKVIDGARFLVALFWASFRIPPSPAGGWGFTAGLIPAPNILLRRSFSPCLSYHTSDPGSISREPSEKPAEIKALRSEI